ncbi:hypothetical protein BYT27DRAFT_7186980 [Phlegmacium glaucopus]|nr:hypothetical protein BYT27DRAFT_7186980 [Phlegmacium glaucopus]
MTSISPLAAPAQVLIVGAGPSGLILALTLLRNGVPVRIIEKSLSPRIGQRGAGITPRSFELFESLGILDLVMQRSISVPIVKMYKGPEGVEILKEFEMTPTLESTPAIPYMNIRLLGQQSLENIIQTEMKQYNSSIELGVELVSLEQFDDGVQVKLHKRNTENSEFEEEISKYGWIVGADGARGAVRKSLGLTFLGETKVEKFAIGDIKVEGLTDNWHMWGDIGNTLTAIRNTETPGVFNFLVGGSGLLDNPDKVTASQDAVRAFLREQTSNRTDIKFGEVIWSSSYRINIRMADRFSKGRVFVAGDAAHVHSPTGGQGMNTGIQDSFNLGWKLAHVIKGYSSPSLLDTYTEERLPVVAEMLNLTTKILKVSLDKPTNEDVWQRTGNLNQLGVNYRGSSIVVDQYTDSGAGSEARKGHSAYDVEAGGLLRAGYRAPDAPGLVEVKFDNQQSNESTRLYKLLSPTRHTVLVFAEAADIHTTLAAIARYPKELVRTVVILRAKSTNTIQNAACDVFEDRDGHAYETYRSAEGANDIVIIRPDGVIGAVVKDVDWLERYFRTIFVD